MSRTGLAGELGHTAGSGVLDHVSRGFAPTEGYLRLQRVAHWLIALFVVLAPVFWLPGISEGVVRSLKLALLVPAAGLVLGTALAGRGRFFPGGVLGPVGFGLLAVLWIPGLTEAASPSDVDALDFLVDLGIHCVVLWCFYCIAKDSNAVWGTLWRAFVVFGVLAGISLVNEIPAVAVWDTGDKWRGDRFGGFGLGSTGWSVSMALFLPLSVLPWLMPRRQRTQLTKALGTVGALILLTSLVWSAGRGGMLASLLTVGVLITWLTSKRLLVALILACSVVAALLCLNQSCAGFLGLEASAAQWDDPASAVCAIDQLSSLRLSGYRLGLEKLLESPFYGHGHRQVLLLDPYPTEVHSLWLKWAVYTGILAPLLLMAMAAHVLLTCRRVSRDANRAGKEHRGSIILGLVVVAGLVASLVEPSVPFGTSSSTLWWAAAGALAGIAALGPQEKSDSVEHV